jgi:UDP-N-acetylglucosamine diphosphorylase/glucosamine-1-phosphate N-acetyltransferase
MQIGTFLFCTKHYLRPGILLQMQNIILFDSEARNHLLPLTATRPMGELRLGITTIREKWEKLLRGSVSYITQEYLMEKYPIHIEDDNIILNAGIVPTQILAKRIAELEPNEALLYQGDLVAARLNEAQFEQLIEDEEVKELQGIDLDGHLPVQLIDRLWRLLQYLGPCLEDDFKALTVGRHSKPISETNQIIGPPELVFIEEGVTMEACILNVTKGPIYIGKNTEVMEGCSLRGPIAIGEESIVKMGAKIYGATSIGPGCRVGGEITRSLLFGNANKAHEGYLGDSILGEWCNLGADTNNSNLKNNYSEVKLWDYNTQRFEKTGLQFFGLVMGDHAKCGINTMFNTGTVVGVFANVFGAGYPRNFIPDFSWGGADTPYKTYQFKDACDTAQAVFSRRKLSFTDLEKAILYHVYDQTAQYRNWEK